MTPIARLDDLSGKVAHCWEFHEPTAGGRADHIDDVIATLHAAEQRSADNDEWVVFVVAYEAAPAFEPAMRTKPSPPEGTPFVWWASFAEREQVEPLPPRHTSVDHRDRAPNRLAYPAAVEAIRARIERGDVFQVNMTDRYHGTFSGEAIDLYAGLVGVQSCSHGAYIDIGTAIVASASPELFFRVENRSISCRPMKGTAARHPRPEADIAVGAALVRSDKDRAENVMIVDLLRNDLSRIASSSSVTVPELFRLERYETVWQLTSCVEAELDEHTGLVELMASLFPCGSVTGAPKIAAMNIIDELEAEPRGVYCGAIGVVAPRGHQPRIECSVPIRTAVADPVTNTFVYGAGGGITWSSDPQAEDDEVRDKARILTRSRRVFDLFETLHLSVVGTRNAALHLDRLQCSADWFGFPFDRAAAERAVADLEPSPVGERLRIVLQRVGALHLERHPLVATQAPVRLAIDDFTTASDDPFCCHKTTYRRHYDDARSRHQEADDVILVNELGNAIETTIANLAYRIGDVWSMPPLSDGGLPGIARQLFVETGRVQQRSISSEDLRRCDELAVVNDLRGWRPAVLVAQPAASASRMR